jgi:hypothetical protein
VVLPALSLSVMYFTVQVPSAASRGTVIRALKRPVSPSR